MGLLPDAKAVRICASTVGFLVLCAGMNMLSDWDEILEFQSLYSVL